MLLRSQTTTPSENTRSRSRSRLQGNNLLRQDEMALSESFHDRSYRSSRASPSKGKSKRRVKGSQDNENMGVVDVRAAEAGLDQAHIVNCPQWKVIDIPEDQVMENVTNEQEAEDVEYTEEFAITLYCLSETGGNWVDLGPAKLTLEANMHSSRAVVRMAHTHRILAHWAVFGGMKVARFLTTVIVVVIIKRDDETEKVASYGLKVDTLEQARELAILLSSTSRGIQANLERIIPKLTADQHAGILESMTDRLLILQRRLGTLQHQSELSSQVESELAGMLAMGAELKQ
ncbi:hypothetical protein RhiJN_28824 [Ceratobasidium sp. AG-Ba]|nr:hypothetical protein RhiJN_28824 [Ceratobasidium sp. AG-Ba]